MTNSADPDQLDSSLFATTGHVVFSKRRINNIPNTCWCGLIGNSCIHIASFGRICFLRNTSICPSLNTLTHGWRITLAEASEGCQFVRALASLCRIGAYKGSSLSPTNISSRNEVNQQK